MLHYYNSHCRILIPEPRYLSLGLCSQGGFLLLPLPGGHKIGLKSGNQRCQSIRLFGAYPMPFYCLRQLTLEDLMSGHESGHIIVVGMKLLVELLLHLLLPLPRGLELLLGTRSLRFELLLELVPSLRPLGVVAFHALGQRWLEVVQDPINQVPRQGPSIRGDLFPLGAVGQAALVPNGGRPDPLGRDQI